MIKVGDIVQRVGNKSAEEIYKVSGVKSNFQGYWITLCTEVDHPRTKPYPFDREKVWMNSKDFEVLSERG